MAERGDVTNEWLRSPLGQHVWSVESGVAAERLAQVFGVQALQIGTWGQAKGLTAYCQTRRVAIIGKADEPGVMVCADLAALPILSDSVDLVVLPHTLELEEQPHSVLREVARILVGDGHLLVLGFNPHSLVGLRHLLTGGRFPAGVQHLISERRLRDWMTLLGFDVLSLQRYFGALPVNHAASIRYTASVGETVGRIFGPAAGAYALLARKSVYTLTPIRPRWRTTTRAVTNLVEPTTRTAA